MLIFGIAVPGLGGGGGTPPSPREGGIPLLREGPAQEKKTLIKEYMNMHEQKSEREFFNTYFTICVDKIIQKFLNIQIFLVYFYL